jgi:hypothetical protein
MTRVSLIAGPIVTATLSALWGNRVVQVLTGLAVMTLLYLFLKKIFTPPDPKEVFGKEDFVMLPHRQSLKEIIIQGEQRAQNRPARPANNPPGYDWRTDPRNYDLELLVDAQDGDF